MVRHRAGSRSCGRSISPIIDEPVPYVAFNCPGARAPCAYRAAWLSPITESSGTPSGSGARPRTDGNGPVEATTRGRVARGMPNRVSRSSSHATAATPSSCVREALPASIRCSAPKRLSSQESMVPSRISPRRARVRLGSRWSSSHFALEAENIGSSGRPLRRRIRVSTLGERNASQSAAVRWSCQLSAGASGSLVAASHIASVSRWLDRPTATTARASCPSRQRCTAV